MSSFLPGEIRGSRDTLHMGRRSDFGSPAFFCPWLMRARRREGAKRREEARRKNVGVYCVVGRGGDTVGHYVAFESSAVFCGGVFVGAGECAIEPSGC